MDKDICWHQRFENLGKALQRFREALHSTAQEPNNHLYQIALIGQGNCKKIFEVY